MDYESDENDLDLIINSFNECWFQGWKAVTEDQTVKIVNLVQKMRNHVDFVEKYAMNTDLQNIEITLIKIFKDVMAKERRN